jgi:hypothetical protein
MLTHRHHARLCSRNHLVGSLVALALIAASPMSWAQSTTTTLSDDPRYSAGVQQSRQRVSMVSESVGP